MWMKAENFHRFEKKIKSEKVENDSESFKALVKTEIETRREFFRKFFF